MPLWSGNCEGCPACGAEISLNLASDSGHEPRLLWVEEIWFSAAEPRKLESLAVMYYPDQFG